MRHFASLTLIVLAISLLAAGENVAPQAGDEPRPGGGAPASNAPDGHLVEVPLPIAGSVDEQVIRIIDRLLDKLPKTGARPVLVLEFDTKNGKTGEGSQFTRCLELARYLSSQKLSRVRTVAYIPHADSRIKGHAVLALMACEEIIMHEDAELGAAGLNEDFIEDTLRETYREIANRRRIIPAPFALGLLDKNLAVYKVTTTDGVRYVFKEELEQLEREGKASDQETVTDAGQLPSFSGRDLRHKFRFVSHLVADRKELASVLQIPQSALEGDPSLGEAWKAIRVDVKGLINSKAVSWIQRSLDDHIQRHGTNFVCLWIESAGGSPEDSLRLAHQLAKLDPAEIRTVAFVPYQARADASLIAMSCDHLVMDQGARLGGPGEYHMSEQELDAFRQSLQTLAQEKNRDWSLFAAMVDRRLTVHRYVREGTGQVRYLSKDEHASLRDAESWREGSPIDTQEGLAGWQAEEIGLVRFQADGFEQFKQFYHLTEEPEILKPTWAHQWVGNLADTLSRPMIASALLFAAMFFLATELSQPGVGVPGFIAGVCFGLFFWSQFLHGTVGGLEILLFLGGMACLAIELFVVPGIGVFGVGGVVFVMASIVLSAQTFIIPQNSYQLGRLGQSSLMMIVSITGVITALVVMRRVLPKTPYLRNMMLEPPGGDEPEKISHQESLVHWAHLQGKRGVTTTQLTPSGKARFGDQVVDVISDGELIPRGAAIYVAEVRGNHVLVMPIDSGEPGV